MRPCSFVRDSTQPPLQPNFEPPIMDLSSLEGPQMVNPRFIVQPEVPARITRSRTPTHILFSKPLPPRPPRPVSADAASHRQRHNFQQGWPSERMMDVNVRGEPAYRGSSSYEVFPDCDPRNQHVLSVHTPQQYPSGPHNRRPRSCNPANLVWLEDEKLWVVGDETMARQHRVHDRPPLQSDSPVSPLSGYHPISFHRTEYDVYHSARNDVPTQLPVNGGHGFGPPHVAQSRDDRVSRWISVVERTHVNRRG
ncbi:unnamed protein product [Penicillium salamii]|nr:unnamed protein product [Penicillium salamii]